MLQAKDRNNAKLIVADPNFTKTAAHADLYLRQRSGTDVALIYGLIHIILKNGWEDKEFIKNYNDLKETDIIEAYIDKEVER